MLIRRISPTKGWITFVPAPPSLVIRRAGALEDWTFFHRIAHQRSFAEVANSSVLHGGQ